MSDVVATRALPDAVGVADRLRNEVATRIDGALGVASAPPADVHVGWFAAIDVAGCPARFRARGEGGWGFPGWSPALAAASVARAALDRHLTIHEVPPGAAGDVPAPIPLAVVRDWMRAAVRAPEVAVADWVADRRLADDAAALAATAAGAARWLAGFLRVFGWPLPPGLALVAGGRPVRWKPSRSSPVTVAASPDARLGRVAAAGRFALVVHRAVTGDDDDARDRAGFEATAAALGIGIVPGEVIVSAGDTGERLRFPVEPDLLARGAALVEAVVRERARAVDELDADAGATPSARCRWCDRRDACGPAQAWLATAGRWRGGLPVVVPAAPTSGGR